MLDMIIESEISTESAKIPTNLRNINLQMAVSSEELGNLSSYFINSTQASYRKGINQTFYPTQYDINYTFSGTMERIFTLEMEIRLCSPIYASFPVPITPLIIGIGLFLLSIGVIFIVRQVLRFKKWNKNLKEEKMKEK